MVSLHLIQPVAGRIETPDRRGVSRGLGARQRTLLDAVAPDG
jgi:hypothetical protein